MTKKPSTTGTRIPTPIKNKNKAEKSKEQKLVTKNKPSVEVPLPAKALPIKSAIETASHCYSITAKLGAGAFGDVYEVLRKSDKLVCAVKVEFIQNSPDRRLEKEYEIYREITKAKAKGAPNAKHLMEIIDYGECKGLVNFMFMPLAGQSLDTILKHKNPTFATAINLADQTLQAIQNFHSFMHIHRDIKPANFVFGRAPDDQFLFLIDFGMAVRYCLDQKKMPASSTYDFIGTLGYAPRSTHLGVPQTRKDDVESWYYMAIEFFAPKVLPWFGEQDTQMVIMLKEQLFVRKPFDIYAQVPPQFVHIANVINKTNPIDAPDYEAIHNDLQSIARNNGVWFNGVLDFTSPELPEYDLY